MDCGCYGLKEVSLGEEASLHCVEEPSQPEVIMKENIGQWCNVKYDGEPYPRIIVEVEEHARVKCMQKNGTKNVLLAKSTMGH